MNDAALLDEILALATRLIRIPSVTVGGPVRFEALQEAFELVCDYLGDAGLEVHRFTEGDYPALVAAFPGEAAAPVMLSGHFDVVAPEPDDSQFSPVVDGDYFRGRGCADMKTMLATLMVWMKDRLREGPPYPPINLMLIGNEEQGEGEPMGTPHVLEQLERDPAWGRNYRPQLLIAAERTGERGDEVWGQIHFQNRGAVRMKLVASGRRTHSSLAGGPGDLVARLAAAMDTILQIARKHLTLGSEDGWQTLLRFPFIQVGEDGVYNITAGQGVLGLEVRPIPQDDLAAFIRDLREYCAAEEIEIQDLLLHPGIRCDPQNPYLKALIVAVRRASGEEPVLGGKLAGTSARFAPDGQGVVWGQTGVHPHSRDEKHFIPSILPYYRALKEFERTASSVSPGGLSDG